jgi:hypothetical protein
VWDVKKKATHSKIAKLLAQKLGFPRGTSWSGHCQELQHHDIEHAALKLENENC